jgi:hypothetical protein
MKKMLIVFAVMVNCVIGATLASVAGIAPVLGAVGLNCISLIDTGASNGLRTGLYTEVWTGILIKAFRNSLESVEWLNRIPSYDQYTENDFIHFVNLGIDPDVLIGNITYPIPTQTLTDADKVVSLDKFQTKVTTITDDEIKNLSYDKLPTMLERHKEAIVEMKIRKALHALAPTTNTTSTPVLLTTGGNDDGNTRKQLTVKDIINLKKQFDAIKVPMEGRILVLCPDHVADLLIADSTFAQQYNNRTTGKISNQYGFDIYEYVDCPQYTVSNKTKLAFNAIPTSTERTASVCYYTKRTMRATGSTKMYYAEASTNPSMQESSVNFRHYFIAVPLKNEAIGAIVSDMPAEEE